MITLSSEGKSLGSRWLKHGFWNTVEHGVTRGADALSSVVLLWAISPETFAKLASSQAVLAPILLIFIAPETALYREYAKWRSEGPSALATRLSALRRFAWGKAQLALLLSALVALFSSAPWSERFWPMVWAFALVMSPQLSGPDREFLRLDLKLKTLNLLSLYQKLTFLVGTCLVAFLIPGRTDVLAMVAVFSAVSTSLIAAFIVKRVLRDEGASSQSLSGTSWSAMLTTISDCLSKFSGWQHVIGIIVGWVQTMDLFFLTVFRLPGYQVGLYAAVLKIANFSLMVPFALSNSFSLWVGRRDEVSGVASERKHLGKFTLLLSGFVLIQSAAILVLSPEAFRLLSHGRWSAGDQKEMFHWLVSILIGTSLYCCTFVVGAWLPLRAKISELFFRVYLPWGLLSLVIYGAMIRSSTSNAFLAAAHANIAVSVVYIVLVFAFLKRFNRR